MGTVFQIINQQAVTPYLRRKRVWLEPGYPTVIWPGLMAILAINNIDGRYEPVLSTYPSGRPTHSFRYSVVARALRTNEQLKPVAVLVDVATDQRVNEPGLRA